jgi:hypothetical protein
LKQIRRFFQFAKSYLIELFGEGRFEKFVLIVAVFVVASQVAMMAGLIHEATDTQAVITAIDNDAGIAIDTTIKTQLYNNNDFTAYGPTYYRAVRILDTFLHLGNYNFEPGDRESKEKSLHFLLMMVSYFSILGTSFVIAYVFFTRWSTRLFASVTLASAFLSDFDWDAMIFRAHPDHMLAFSVTLAALMTWQSYAAPTDRRKLLFATAAWGFVASVKMSIIMFAPVFVLFFLPLPPRNQLWLFIRERALYILGGLTVSYLAFGFPQSLDIVRVIGFLVDQKRNVLPGDTESLQSWISLFGRQMQMPFLILAVMFVFLPITNRKLVESVSLKKALLFVLFFTLPILFLISRKIISPFAWYPFPFIGALLVASAVTLNLCYQKYLAPHLPARMLKYQNHVLYAPLFFAVLSFIRPTIPQAVAASLQNQLACRPEARIVAAKVNAEAARGGSVLADPYTPYARKYHDKEVLMAWEMNMDLVIKKKPTMIALKGAQYSRYIPLEEGGTASNVIFIKDWEATHAFYRTFWKKSDSVDSLGQRWVKIYSDACTFELWQRQTPPP